MVLLRGFTGVGQPILGDSQYSHFHSRHLQQDAPQSEMDLWKLYSDFGAPPRSLFQLADRPDKYEHWVKMEVQQLSSESLIRLLRDARAATEDSHCVIATGPLLGDRSKAERTFASPYVLEACCKLFLDDGVDALRRHFTILHGDPTTSTAAGMIFELRAHQFLRREKTITLFPILGRIVTNGKYSIVYDNYEATKNAKDQKQVRMPNLEEYIIVDETDMHVEYDTYYHPKRRNFPSIDSWVLVRPGPGQPPIFIMFQITTNARTRDVKQEGLDIMYRLDIPGNALRWLVVLTPKEVCPNIGSVMTEYLLERIPAVDTVDVNVLFPIFHYPIDIE